MGIVKVKPREVRQYKLLVTLLYGNHPEVGICPVIDNCRIGFAIVGLGRLGRKMGYDAYYLYRALEKLEQVGLIGNLTRSTNKQEAYGWIALPTVLERHYHIDGCSDLVH